MHPFIFIYFFAELSGMLIRPDTFSYAEMRTATNDFNPANLLGEGGFGVVFKVCLLLLLLNYLNITVELEAL